MSMYYIEKRIEISACHRLDLDYESKCTRVHGHNWMITVFCKSETLDRNGMVIDFSEIKRLVKDPIDHQVLNDVLPFNPTAENLAHWVVERVPCCYKATVQESEGNIATYEI